MNSFIALAELSRTTVMRETGMDELDYHLAILEAGCHYLDELVKPRGTTSAPELSILYREHLTKIGYWNFFEKLVCHLEIAVADHWKGDALIAMQPEQWKRKRWLAELKCLPWKMEATNQLELWLKQLGPKRTLVLPVTESKPQQQPQHEHVH